MVTAIPKVIYDEEWFQPLHSSSKSSAESEIIEKFRLSHIAHKDCGTTRKLWALVYGIGGITIGVLYY